MKPFSHPRLSSRCPSNPCFVPALGLLIGASLQDSFLHQGFLELLQHVKQLDPLALPLVHLVAKLDEHLETRGLDAQKLLPREGQADKADMDKDGKIQMDRNPNHDFPPREEAGNPGSKPKPPQKELQDHNRDVGKHHQSDHQNEGQD